MGGTIENRAIGQKYLIPIKKLAGSQACAHARLGSPISPISAHSRLDGLIAASSRGLDCCATQ
jgi:hypothetical protein